MEEKKESLLGKALTTLQPILENKRDAVYKINQDCVQQLQKTGLSTNCDRLQIRQAIGADVDTGNFLPLISEKSFTIDFAALPFSSTSHGFATINTF